MQTPIQLYNQYLATREFKPDPQQKQAISHLQRIHDELAASQKPHFLNKWLPKKRKSIHGLYMWGSVGIGKTWLMDIFYQTLPTDKKIRMHFHRFMQQVHEQLKTLQGQADPLMHLAKKLAAQTQIICLDEFLVTDIVDAMILANLLRALFAEGITLVTTSNTAPDDLYPNGFQREYFLEAVKILKQRLTVLHLTTANDYRLRVLEQAGIYHYPLDRTAEDCMRNSFKQLTGIEVIPLQPESLFIEGRNISVIAQVNQVVWFEFSILCNVPRSQLDYLQIARCFHTVLLSNVPKIEPQQDNVARYLINLVDIFYDAKVKLIISAAVPIAELYTEGRLVNEFKRTQSRLLEMQSFDYLKMPHLA